jgi:hypothetical protein
MHRNGVDLAPYLRGKFDEDAVAAAALVGVGPAAMRRGAASGGGGGGRGGGGLGGGVGVGVIAHGGGSARSGPVGGSDQAIGVRRRGGRAGVSGGMSGSVETMARGPVPGCVEPSCRLRLRLPQRIGAERAYTWGPVGSGGAGGGDLSMWCWLTGYCQRRGDRGLTWRCVRTCSLRGSTAQPKIRSVRVLCGCVFVR